MSGDAAMSHQDTAKYQDRGKGPVFSGQDVRQSEIILRTKTRRIIFIVGLVGAVVLALILQFLAR
jgi:hypothetical protein